MKSRFAYTFLLISCLQLVVAPHGTAADPFFADQSIEKLIKSSGVPLDSLSFYAEVYPSGTPLVKIQPEKLMNPASVSKLVTAAAALDSFPPGHQFQTLLISDAAVADGKLKGNLYLVGGGDPAFVSESMWNLVNHFLRSGIQSIEGDIIVDDTVYDAVRFGETRRKKRVDRAYDAPVGAMSFNWNSVNVFVRPGVKVGAPAQVWIDPKNDYISLVNTVKTVKGNGRATTSRRTNTAKGDRITVSGTIGIGSAEQVHYNNITKPAMWSGSNLKAFLERRNVTVKGEVKLGEAPAKAQVLSSVKSKPIALLVADMNKFSNNYVAEMLTKGLASAKKQEATVVEGVKLLTSYLKRNTIGPEHIAIVSPSGLSNKNRMSASGTVDLLKAVRKDFRVFPEFITALPVSGVDGTLKNRFTKSSAIGWVRAKTGYLNGAVSLAGYAGREDGQMVLFAFFHNGKGEAWKVRRFFDELATHLISTRLEDTRNE